MTSTESEKASIVDVRTIHVRNFSRDNLYKGERTHFVIERNNRTSEIFSVLVYRNGIDSKSRQYVSVDIFKVHKETDPQAFGFKDSLSWTLSVVGIDGVGKYYQSFVEKNTANEFYSVRIPKFLERSVILEQSDELLPDDVLTVRVELSGMSYTALSPSEGMVFQLPFLKDVDNQEGEEDSKLVVRHSRLVHENRVESDLGLLFVTLVNALVFMFRFRRDFQGDVSGVEASKHFLPLTDPMDEIKSMYLGSNPLFQTYVSLNTKFRKSLRSIFYLSEENSAKENMYMKKLEVISNVMGCLYTMPKVRFVFGELEGDWLPWLSWTIDIEVVGDENPIEAEKSIKMKDDNISQTNVNAGEGSSNENRCPVKCGERVSSELGTIAHEKLYKEEQKQMKEENCAKKVEESQLSVRARKEKAPETNIKEDKRTQMQNQIYLRAIDACKAKALDLRLNGAKITKEENILVKAMDEYEPTDFRHEIDFIKDAICYLMLEVNGDTFASEDSDDAIQNNLNIETMDGVTFAVPFENDKESFGSKLVSCSPVFKTMLKHPMRERFHKMVRLGDIDSHTFINFLIYLRNGCLMTETLSQVTDLYEMADKYDIKELMQTCAQRMVPYFSTNNIDDIEVLAFFHSDDFLLQLVETFKNKKTVPQLPSFAEANWQEELAKQLKESFNFEEIVEPAQENKFDFYQ
ncbi:uncharacterized protein NPIL_123211 [Nephila pilipes]|uniref:BTB domain-containing protein n=1 Tax=Nephila pilipes TaxID=299642 RepID=A0A8X6MXK4_NEPPI|nr:uncharacterized protein NPIL_123211 [Nephila pilipes]